MSMVFDDIEVLPICPAAYGAADRDDQHEEYQHQQCADQYGKDD
jgi:hypothetical protein